MGWATYPEEREREAIEEERGIWEGNKFWI